MLQDIAFGRLENEFHILTPQTQDAAVCVRSGAILLRRDSSGVLTLPTAAQAADWCRAGDWDGWAGETLRYVFRMEGRNYFLFLGNAGDCPEAGFAYIPARQLREPENRDLCFAAMTAWHLYNWYGANRYCGRCGSPTRHDGKERMLRCDSCGNMIFPRINPAVIVAVTDGDRLLLTKYAGRGYTHYALIAGFTEIGETLEQTVQREVMEEVGLRVTNIRYYKSQPWGVDGNILMGFYCDLEGDGTVTLDEKELALAQWHPRNAIPIRDDGISLTREMIRIFEEGREPR